MIHYIRRKKAVILPSDILITLCQTIFAPFCRFLLWAWGGYTVRVHFDRKLKPTQRYIIAANHQSRLDPFAIFALLPLRHRLHILPIKFMTFPKMYHKPYLKPFMFAFGSFPAHAKERRHHTYGVEGSVKLLNQGYNICIFPEGTRTLRHQSRAHSGVSRIAAAHPEAQVLLAHIDWHVSSVWRRHVTVTLAMPPKNLNLNDPKAIVDAIYTL